MKLISKSLYASAVFAACASIQTLTAAVFTFEGATPVYDATRAQTESTDVNIFSEYASVATVGFNWSNTNAWGSWQYSWDGINVSNCSDTKVDISQYWNAGEKGQYTSNTGTDGSGIVGGTYGVFYGKQTGNPYATPAVAGTGYSTSDAGNIMFNELVSFSSVQVANTLVSYDYLSKNFNDSGDTFLQEVQVFGIDANGDLTENYVSIVLSSASGVADSWVLGDLSGLNVADGLLGLSFRLYTEDFGEWGANAPAYFAVDNIGYNAIPEPADFAAMFGFAALAIWAFRRKGGK